MSEHERPPIDLFLDRLPIDFDHNKDEIAKEYTLKDHVRDALEHNLALIQHRLDGIEEVFTELYALTSEVTTYNPGLAQQMRTAISWGRTGQLQGARWLIEALIHGLDPYAMGGVTSLQHRREGAKRAQETIQQRRNAYKQAWREEAVRRWKSHRRVIIIPSVNRVATWIREACLTAHKAERDVPHVCVLNPNTEEQYSVRAIRDTIRDLKPRRG